MKKGSTLFLKASLFAMAFIALTLCIFALPSFIPDGIQYPGIIYPVMIALYAAAIPFFLALYQAWKLLTYIDDNSAFSDVSVKALKNIKYCAVAVSICFAACMPFMFRIADLDDAPGLILIWGAITCAPLVIAVFAAVLQKLLKNVIDIKTENDLTV